MHTSLQLLSVAAPNCHPDPLQRSAAYMGWEELLPEESRVKRRGREVEGLFKRADSDRMRGKGFKQE